MSDWIDSHTHLEKFARNGELEAVLGRAREAGVGRVITVGTSPEDWPLYRELSEARPESVAFTAGLHPCDVDGNWAAAVDALRAFLEEGTRPVALGETGLDRFHLPKDEGAASAAFERQREAFRSQIRLAAERELPLVVHSRGAFRECLDAIDASGFDWERVVFHCFAEGVEEVRELNRRGGRASFTGIITYKNAEGVREALREQGAERLMVETDAPYLAPVPHRGKRNEPAFVAHTGNEAARILGMEPREAAAVSSANAVRFFGLADGCTPRH